MQIDEEDLAAFSSLVQDGLIEVVTIENGMQYYRIASEFAGPLEPSFVGWRIDRVSDTRHRADVHLVAAEDPAQPCNVGIDGAVNRIDVVRSACSAVAKT